MSSPSSGSPRARCFRKALLCQKRSHVPLVSILARKSRTCLEGPFGEVIRATGLMAKVNPLRFSTKYQDDETDLLYYGYRYYNASMGRWLSRDPIGEDGGLNLYGFVCNSPINLFDLLGLYDNCCCDKSHIDAGKNELLKRYQSAKSYLDPHAPKRPFDTESTWSCFNLAKNILQYMASLPPCWKCHVENRTKYVYRPWPWMPVTYDENSIVCTSQPKSGASETIVFDYYQQWTAVPYSTFTSKFPDSGTQGFVDARSDDCSKKDPHTWGNNAFLDNIIHSGPSSK
jgi:RHS repeat-associated protein